MTLKDRPEFSGDQIERLLRPIKPNRVFHNQGHSNVAAWEIKAHLTRMFGFGGWEKEILELERTSAARGEELGYAKEGWYVTYRCRLRLRVFVDGELAWQTDDVATGTAQNQPTLHDAEDFACKNAVSYALKRCAVDLGDQFGLSLYNKGSLRPVVGMTLIGGVSPDGAEEPDVEVEGEGGEHEAGGGYE